MVETARLKTVGDLAREADEPAHIIDYAIRRYRIEETQRVGILRVYDADAAEQIKAAVRRVRADRRGGGL